MKLPIPDIARLCHEANRTYCAIIGDHSQVPWEQAEGWQQESANAGIRFIMENPNVGPGDMHRAWYNHKIKDGWKYGAVKNPALKEHPQLIPYDQLEDSQKLKDKLFLAVARACL